MNEMKTDDIMEAAEKIAAAEDGDVKCSAELAERIFTAIRDFNNGNEMCKPAHILTALNAVTAAMLRRLAKEGRIANALLDYCSALASSVNKF